MTDNVVIGLDIGTCYVRAVIGVINEDNSVEILGVAKRASPGFLRNGVIVNIESAKEVVKDTIEDAEMNAGIEAVGCVAGIGGAQIESHQSQGQVAINTVGKRERSITEEDRQRVLQNANAFSIPMTREILHLIPQDYIVNGVPGYKDPLNNFAVRLEVDVCIITASTTQIKNIKDCVARTNYDLDKVFLKTLACTEAVMGKDERELGSILIDLGGGSTDAVVIYDDAPICTISIPAGGKLVTNDIVKVWGISPENAEKIKIENGCAWAELVGMNEEVLVPGIGGKAPELKKRIELSQIIQARIIQIFQLCFEEIKKKCFTGPERRYKINSLDGNIILTGGGALMNGVVEAAKYVFQTSAVRIGVPGNFGGIEESYRTSEWATAVGLIIADKGSSSVKHGKKQKVVESTDEENFLTKGVKKFINMFF
ncbi:cell division protein FtsA [Treponema zioleckii]|uniref:cell division protein FtsA n=1 Tax=Treponema zioleckii TaxID=331680 RepID=UPI00168BD491|nr:cell division protein FtsA [Treponema zioleckii]